MMEHTTFVSLGSGFVSSDSSLLMLPYAGIRWEMVSVVGPPAHQVARTAESERRKTDLGRAWGKLNERPG